MIKIGTTGIDKVDYQGNIAKVMKGIDLVWEKVKVFFEGTSKSVYRINIEAGKTYTFTTSDPYDTYTLSSGGKEYKIKSGTTFIAESDCEIKIINSNYSFFDIKIYESDGSADIRIEKIETLVYTQSGRSYYDISINNWSDLKTNKNYKFMANRSDNYTISSNGRSYPISSKDVFTVNQNCDLTIRNTDYNLFELKIYETTEPATIIF